MRDGIDGINDNLTEDACEKFAPERKGDKPEARRSVREIAAEFAQYKYDLYKEKYIHGNDR